MKRSLLLASIAIVCLPAISQSAGDKKAIATFVQGFYDWYVPIANKDMHGPACGIALKKRLHVFTPELAQALQEDLIAQAKSPGVIVGIDWDPFLNCQDPETQYKVGAIKSSKGGYLANVHVVTAGKLIQPPCVLAEVIQANGEWVFSNFRSPQGLDLLASLARFRKERQRSK